MKGKQNYDLKHGFHRVNYATSAPILVSVNDEPKEVLNGRGRIILRNFSGKVSLDPTDKNDYKFEITSRESQEGEKFDDRDLPAVSPPNSYLAKLKAMVADTMVTNREAFAEHRSIYEVVDDLDTFEEERQAAENKRQTDENNPGQNVAETSPETAATTEDTGSVTSKAEASD